MKNFLAEKLMVPFEESEHIPVMLDEVLNFLALKPGQIVVDCTIGTAGHSERLLETILPGGKLIGLDRDDESLKLTEEKLSRFKGEFHLFHENFINLDEVLKNLNITKVDAIFFDLGLSSYQLKAKRGFSFKEDSFLDMRMDKSDMLCAYDIINFYSQNEISKILKRFGEERFHERIATEIVITRRKKPIETTKELVEIIIKAVPYSYLKSKIHPATRTFQALRIAVNRELMNLELALEKAVELLLPGGRIAVISFHSLEDRIVKRAFRNYKHKGYLEILTPKPIRPTELESKINPRARSAKLRVAQRRKNNRFNLLMKIFML